MNYTAYELSLLGKDVFDRCPICNDEIVFDYDGDDEYLLIDGELYHCECVDEIAERFGADYIDEKCLKEYCEWFYNADFHGEVEPVLIEYALKDINAILQFIEDDEEVNFVEWYNEKEKDEARNYGRPNTSGN